MALHDLVTLKHRLTQALKVDPVSERLIELRDNIAAVKNMVPVLTDRHRTYIDGLIKHYEDTIAHANKPVAEFEVQLKTINDEINALTQKLFANNYELEERYGNVDQVRQSRRIYVREDIEEVIKQRILLHTSWRYPALEIGCRDGEWTQFLVASDPLYIMDRQKEFLESAANKFTPEYQRRLRQYPLTNHDLSALPVGQFAFVFSWGYFNYVSIDTMKQYLRQVYTVLRPGGTFMFSYNDGDTPAGAGMAENFAQTYMPKSMLKPLCESIGYNITQEFDFEPNVNWIEIKKPGTLHTVKSHQVLGEIKKINN